MSGHTGLDNDKHEQRARELVYMSLDAADAADVNRQALMIWARCQGIQGAQYVITVSYVRQNFDTRTLNCDDEGRRCRSSFIETQIGII
jgi:hypothetical protein